jgi:multiple sugar transport system permease protein
MTDIILKGSNLQHDSLIVRLRKFWGRDAALGYVLTLPMILFTLGMLFYPFSSALILSFQDKLVGQTPKFIGLDNYIRLFTADPIFPRVILNTLLYTVITVALKLCLGMGMALMLNQTFRFRGFVRGIMLLPYVTPDLVVALTWRWIFDATFGVLNYILKTLDIIQINVAWLSNAWSGLGAVSIANIWRGFPFFGICLLAGMQAIPGDHYEAAEMDGANVFQRWWNITVPALKAVTMVAVVLSTIWTFNDFTLLYIMTGGAPADQTHIFATYTYVLSFKYNRIGYAMALTVVMLPILIGLIMVMTPRMFRQD